MLALPALGYGYAHWEWALDLRAPGGFAAVLAGWTALHAGTLWLNAALDRDEGEVLFGRSPGRLRDGLSRRLPALGLAALGAGVGLAAGGGPFAAAAAALCAILAVLYSHPRTAWKGHPLLGPAVNLLGYGVCSPLAGFAVVGAPPTARSGLALALVVAWTAATYFGAQAFQGREDAARGYRTLAATAGPRAAVGATRLGYAASIWGLGIGAALGAFPRLLWAVLPVWAWLDLHLARWAAEPEPGPDGARIMIGRATVLAAAVMLAVTAAHLWQIATGRMPAGLGTAWTPIGE